jgi:hypothetical protein
MKMQTKLIGFLALLIGLNSAHVQADIMGLLMKAEEIKKIQQQREAYINQAISGELSTKESADSNEKSAQETSLPIEPEKRVKVTAIFSSEGRKRVQINGEIYQENEVKNEIQVHRIYSNYVTLSIEERWGKAHMGQVYSFSRWPEAYQQRIDIQRQP